MDVKTRKMHIFGGSFRNESLLVLALLLLIMPLFGACKAAPGEESAETSKEPEGTEVSWLTNQNRIVFLFSI